MIQLLSRLEVADNTGAKQVSMIRRLGQLKKLLLLGILLYVMLKKVRWTPLLKKAVWFELL